MTTLSGPMLPPASGGPPKQVVVLLHGYGSDGSDLIALATHWRDILPDALFVSPNAPEPVPEAPGGFQWFALQLDRPLSRMTGVPLARPAIVAFLDALWQQTGLGAAQTLLVGFSQGAMMALHVGTSLGQPLAGVVAFSGALIPPDGFDSGVHARPPVCLVHGAEDDVVPPQLSVDAAAALRAQGYAVSLHLSPGVGHGIAPDGLGFASAFIEAVSTTG